MPAMYNIIIADKHEIVIRFAVNKTEKQNNYEFS